MSQMCSMRTGLRAPSAGAGPARRAARVVPRATAEQAKAKVSFTLPRHVEFGQEVAIVGEIDTLGKWEPEAAIQMSWTDGDIWTAEAEVPVGATVEYKYIVRSPDDGKVLEWQPCDNLVISIPEAAATSDGPVVIKDEWDGAHELLIGADAPEAEPVAPVVSAAEEAPAAAAPAAEAAPAEAKASGNGAAAKAAAAPAPKAAAAKPAAPTEEATPAAKPAAEKAGKPPSPRTTTTKAPKTGGRPSTSA